MIKEKWEKKRKKKIEIRMINLISIKNWFVKITNILKFQLLQKFYLSTVET